MAFKNRIRLPFYITRPQFPTESNVFRLANGTRKTLSTIVLNTFDGETDNLPKHIHERLLMALKHDEITIEGKYLTTGVSMDGDYSIDWNKFLDYPLAKAEFKVYITPFNYSNDNCQTCEQASQLDLQDDTVTGLYESLDEGMEYEFNVFANDTICCSPITAEIVTINSLYIESASIDETSGIITLTINASVPSAILANLVTYRVTCPDGSYDEADVFANISGSEIPSCEEPGELILDLIGTTNVDLSWVPPSTGTPAGGYYYELYLASNLVTPIQTGTTSGESVSLTGLTADTDYYIYIQSVCDESNKSIFVNTPFTTDVNNQTCGQYQVHYNDGSGNPNNFTIFQYIDCEGINRPTKILNLETKLICALQNEPADPVSITGPVGISFGYLGLC